MKISYNWLKQFIKIDWTPEKTGELLTNIGLEVEGIEAYDSVKGGLRGIVVGKVLTCKQHPNADRLKITTVNVGGYSPLQIVCGAPNIAAGQLVPVATVGTSLYTPEGNLWKISVGKIRGEESFGMICAKDELGLGNSNEGIMVLDDELKVGTPVSEVFEVENDYVFEIGLTPNRSDAMSHLGVSRDLKAGLLQQDIALELITPSVSAFHVDNRMLKINVDVLNIEKCPRYCGVTISNLKVQDSPSWLQNRLKAIGIVPINNVVDATNYVLHELGQPLHAFDTNKIKGHKIEVKTCKEGTSFTTLDNVVRKLNEDDLMICDAEKPLCIAGVFGGNSSGVSENTTSVFLESAYFEPISIRKTAKRHNLNTDASFRFERGIDPNITIYALKRAALLIVEVAGGKITSDISDTYPKKIKDYEVRLSFDNAKKLIGEELPKESIKKILTSLEIKINNITETGVGLIVPSYRKDVQREADVIEEILRIYGYNKIRISKKLNASIINLSKIEDYKLQNIISTQLTVQGFYEIITNSLTTEKYKDLSDESNTCNNIQILNPLSKDLAIMRQSLLFSGLEVIAYNLNRKSSELKLFEFGKSYHQCGEIKKECKHLALFISGNRYQVSWNAKVKPSDFFYLKGIIETILKRLGLNTFTTTASNSQLFSEGLCCAIGKKNIVNFGLIKPEVLKYFKISQAVLFADFNWDNILDSIVNTPVLIKPISKYPEVRRDLALLINHDITFKNICDIAKQTEKKFLKAINLFDVYKGNNLPKGKQSYAVSFIIQDEQKTLTDKKIDKIMNRLQANLKSKLGAELR